MFWLFVFLLGFAQAEENSQRLTWDLEVDGQHVGRRIVAIRDVQGRFQRRTMEVWTEVNATTLGSRFSYKQRLTASIAGGPAAFHSVVTQSGRPKEIQGRRAGLGWQISVVAKGRARSWALDADAVDLSTVDLFNPNSRVHLTRLKYAKLLSAETGDILEGEIQSLGSSRLFVGGQSVQVQGYRLQSDTTQATFFFTAEGLLVRYETYLVGLPLSGTLSTAPPPGADEFPVAFGPGQITETNLL
jgi:hypothetical protein